MKNNKVKKKVALFLVALACNPIVQAYSYTIETTSDSINTEDIASFYATGFCPYPVHGIFAADTPMWSQEFNDILNLIATHYNLTNSLTISVVGENLTREKALGMIYDTLSFSEDLGNDIDFADRKSVTSTLQSAVDTAVDLSILPLNEEGNLNPKDTLTKAMAATAIVNLVNYIEYNLKNIPQGGGSSAESATVLTYPVNVNIPFSFNTYSKPYATGNPVNYYEPCEVKLVAVEQGGWWKVNINGKLEWLYTQGQLTYAHAYQPIYSNINTLEIKEYIHPQVFTILGEHGDFVKVDYGYGESWLNAKGTNHQLHNTTIVNIPESFNLNLFPKYDDYKNTINEILYPAQTAEVSKIAENGFWYVECNGAEGWYDSKDKFIYIPDGVTLYDKDDVESNIVGTLTRQVLTVEEIKGNYSKITTWLGSKWIVN